MLNASDFDELMSSAPVSLGTPGLNSPISGDALWAKEFSDQRWLVESIWPEQSCGFISGPSGARKTWLALELCISVATGKPALKRFMVPRAGPALYIAGEDQLKNLQSRMKLLAQGRGISASELGNLHFTAEQGILASDDARQRLEGYCQSLRPRLIVLDPLVRMHMADENSATELQPILASLRQMQRTYGVSLLVTHHLRKKRGEDSNGGRKMELLRGTGDLGAWADTVIVVERHGEHGAAPSMVLVAKQRDVAECPPFMVTLEISPEGGRLKFHEGDATELTILDIMQRILETLRACDSPKVGMLKVDLEKATRGSNVLKREALERLSDQGKLQIVLEQSRGRDGKKRMQKFVRLGRSTPAGTAKSGLAGVPPAQPPTPAAPLGGAGVGRAGREDQPPPGLPVGGSPSRKSELSVQAISEVQDSPQSMDESSMLDSQEVPQG